MGPVAVKVQPRVLKGFRDFLPLEQAPRAAMLETIAQAFESCAFEPLSTPAVEYLDVLTGKYGDEGDKLLYQFKDHGDRDVALRYDLTVPLARVVAQHRDLPSPFKRYQIGTVWRAEKPAHGRFREFVQCDADIVGTGSPLADADCISAGILALTALGIDRFQVRISQRAVLNALLERQGIADPAVQVGVLRVLDKLDKIGADKVVDLLAGLDGVDPGTARGLLDALLGLQGDAASVIPRLKDELDDPGNGAASHLGQVMDALEAMGLSRFVGLDLSIARGLDYYTGTVFETTLLDLPGVGSVMSGGRYDNLLETFGKGSVPAVGISIGVDRLFASLVELNQTPEAVSGPMAVLCPMGDFAVRECLKLLGGLRREGIPSEMVPDASWRMKKQLQFASRRRARFALILGDTELSSGTVMLKDMEAGTQSSVDVGGLTATLREALERGNDRGR